jgi:hypothetical protein
LIPVLLRELLAQALERILDRLRSARAHRAHRGFPRLPSRPICTGNHGGSARLPCRVQIAGHGATDATHFRELEMTLAEVAARIGPMLEERLAAL